MNMNNLDKDIEMIEKFDAQVTGNAAEKNAENTAVEPDNRETVISFRNVTKEYRLYKNEKARFRGLFSKRVPFKLKKAVNNLSFEVKRGDGLALLGRNGAGKSTILKMITGVTFPTTGEINVKGKISALLELSSGFDSESTGIENIYLKCSLLGMSNEEIANVLDDIVSFADLGDYIDQPLRSYSSGMKSRLGFAISVNVKPDILIVDEALSVGDKKFKKKCIERVRELMSDNNVTLLFVTHSFSTALEFCQSGIVLEQGKKLFEGPIQEAIEFYDARE